MNRKSFIRRMAMGISGLFIAPSALDTAEEEETQKARTMEKKIIKAVKRLGFQWETSDPFLFCVHHEDKFPKGKEDMSPDAPLTGRHLGDDFIIKDGFRMYHGKKIPGFPGHPHRGFETITVVREGIVDHADSLGAAGRYGNGDVQWMTAGKGVQHSEMFPLIHADRENPMELFQIWLNLPAKSKMVEPHFKMLWRENIPHLEWKDAAGRTTKIEVIAGALKEASPLAPPPDSWASPQENEVAIWILHLDEQASCVLPKASAGVNRTLYFYEGEKLHVAGSSIDHYHAVEVEASVDLNISNGNKKASVLVLQGRPIGEPVIQYGPFVMNTKQEIHQAFEDYNTTQFGGWPWPRYDQVHPKNAGRFARHSDGNEEKKNG